MARLKTYLLALALLSLGACTQRSGRPVEDETVHAFMAGRISQLAQRIEALAFDQNRTLPELGEDRQRVADQIVEAARALSGVAGELTELGGSLALDSSGRRQFQALSTNLVNASNAVADAAATQSLEDMPESIATLQGTCTACHSIYRGR